MAFPFFNAHHSPVGAFATFTLGTKGPQGGFGLELGGPADESVYIGVEDVEVEGTYWSLPFHGTPDISSEDYDVEGLSDLHVSQTLQPFPDEAISRNLGAAIDEWRAGDLCFRIYSPPRAVPDPELEDACNALTPAVLFELTIDNRKGRRERRAFFGYAGSDRAAGMRLLDEEGLTGVGQGTSVAIATKDADVFSGLAWQPEAILRPRLEANLGFMLGSLGLLVGTVAPGEVRTFRFAAAFFRDGVATNGIRTRYLYRRWFDRVEDVLHSALDRFDQIVDEARAFDGALNGRLSPERTLMLAHAIRSYYGATQLLEREDGTPLWVVHEGEYRMMNTFDLTVDQAFFELAMNPWTVRNVLDLFVSRYSYEDRARLPGSDVEVPAGIAFTHDMGVANTFSPPGRSGYEQAGLRGCFSYMSAEELLNWVLTAGLYVFNTRDLRWASENRSVFLACLESLERRDHPDDALRNGVVGLDGARCAGGKEITTYDSLDASLGQARNNVYLAVKGWAAYRYLDAIFEQLEEVSAAVRARRQAERAAQTIVSAQNSDGTLPAILGEGVEARIIPAIEGLVYPHVAGLSIDTDLRSVLAQHFQAVLREGVCLFPDGGWKLSSTSRNSWLSKIYLCQYVAEQVLGIDGDPSADHAHLAWLMDSGNGYFAWSDQMLAGRAVGSRYYPRGVTGVLWLSRGGDPILRLKSLLSGGTAAVA